MKRSISQSRYEHNDQPFVSAHSHPETEQSNSPEVKFPGDSA